LNYGSWLGSFTVQAVPAVSPVQQKVGQYGTLKVDRPTGGFTYEPNASAINALTANTTDTFTVSVNDDATPSLQGAATLTVNITGVNDTPALATPTAIAITDTAAADTFSASTGTLSATDRDTGATFTYGITGGTVASGKSTKVGTYGTLEVNTSTGAYTFTPNNTAINALAANTSESFTVTVSDGGLSNTATLAVNITGVNDAPDLGDPDGDRSDRHGCGRYLLGQHRYVVGQRS
jgi:VCBS repeat-containing protein